MTATDHSIATRNKQLAMDMFTHMAAGEVEPLRRIFAADVRWHYPRSFAPDGDVNPDPLHLGGREGMLKVIESTKGRMFREPLPPPEFLHAIVEGNMVALLTRVRATMLNGDAYENFFMFHVKVEDDEIVEVWELQDSAYLRRMMSRT